MSAGGAPSQRDWFQLGVLAVLLLLLAANAVLFYRFRQLQAEVRTALADLTREPDSDKAGLAAGTPAPDFQLALTDGGQVALADFAGAPLLLVFTATDCEACGRAYPMLRRMAREHDNWRVLIIARGPEAEVRDLAARQDLPYPVALWQDGLTAAYAVSGTPLCTAIAGNGSVIGAGYIITAARLERLLARAAP